MANKPSKGQYIEILLRSPKTVFSTKDIALLWGEKVNSNVRVRLSSYVKNRKLIRVYHGIYAKDKNYDRFELANRIYTPSYISFETVLTRAGVNFQYYGNIFVASYVTREIEADGQKISFIRIKDYVLSNTIGIEHVNDVAIAIKERAFLDRIYISKDYHFDNLDPLDWDKVFEILPIYRNKRMNKKVEECYRNYEDGQLIEQYFFDKIKEDMFANKLMAMCERIGKTSRDVYDVYFFAKNNWPINKKLVEDRAKMPFKDVLVKCVELLEKMDNRHILDGLGEMLVESKKDWARAKLRTETIFLLKAWLESEK